MADLVDLFTDFAHSLLRPREFSEKRLAPDSLAALKAGLMFAATATGLLLIGSGAKAERTFAVFYTMVLPFVPMAALLFLFQMKRGISFLQALAICVLISGYVIAWIAALPLMQSFTVFFVGGGLLLFYVLGFAAPKMLIGITKTSYGAAVGAVLAAYVGGAIIFWLILPALGVSIFS